MPIFLPQLAFSTMELVCSQKLGYWEFDPIFTRDQSTLFFFCAQLPYVRREMGPNPLDSLSLIRILGIAELRSENRLFGITKGDGSLDRG